MILKFQMSEGGCQVAFSGTGTDPENSISVEEIDERPYEEQVWHKLTISDAENSGEVKLELFGDDAEHLRDVLDDIADRAVDKVEAPE